MQNTYNADDVFQRILEIYILAMVTVSRTVVFMGTLAKAIWEDSETMWASEKSF